MEIGEYVQLQEVLDKSCSLAAFQKNVRAEYKAGKRAKGTQHVAIAMSVLKRACGVDDDVKGSPKEIVQKGGGKLEGSGRFIPLDFIIELKGVTKADTKTARRTFVLWLASLRKAADAASTETMSTSRYVSGKRTRKLQKILKTAAKRKFPPPGDVTFRMSSGLRQKLGDSSPRFADLFERISHMGSFGPDYTIAMGIHGVGTSPSASTSPERSRYNVQHTAQGIVSGRRRKKGRLGTKSLPAGQGTRF